jgi:mono/diheme cytochrome c family protein
MMTTRIAAGVVIVAAAAASLAAYGLAGSASDQQSTQDKPFSLLSPSLYGVDNFHAYCSPCHGRTGRGDGPVAPALKRRPSDLTTLAKRNRGVFPRAEVRNFITTGGPEVPEHGTSDMPVWGPTFRALDSSDRSVAIRIANVVEYLSTIQQ